jgi:hypothetical protein
MYVNKCCHYYYYYYYICILMGAGKQANGKGKR